MAAEANVYAVVYHVLLVGMYSSTALFVVGIILALRHPQFLPFSRDWILAHYTRQAVAGGLAHGDPTAIMMVATVLLMLTPVARVAASLYAFAVDKDYKYVVITGMVLAIMALTVVFGLLGLH